MGIRNALKGGTDFTEEGLKPTIDLNPTLNAFYMKAYADNTGSSIDNSTTETDLATFTITQNDLENNFSVLINSSFKVNGSSASTSTHTLRLYVNGVVVKTQTQALATGSGTETSGGGINHLASGLDSTAGNIIIKVTGQNSVAILGIKTNVDGLTGLAINNNS